MTQHGRIPHSGSTEAVIVRVKRRAFMQRFHRGRALEQNFGTLISEDLQRIETAAHYIHMSENFTFIAKEISKTNVGGDRRVGAGGGRRGGVEG